MLLTVECSPRLGNRIASGKEERQVSFGEIPERNLPFRFLPVLLALFLPLPECLTRLVDAIKELVVVDSPKRFESGSGIRRVNGSRFVKVIYYSQIDVSRQIQCMRA